ncbi:hypothetical protein Tco_1338460 [Tanacetum coccineum]
MAKASGHFPVIHVEKVEEAYSKNKQSYASSLNGGVVNKPQRQDVAKKTISLSDDELVQVSDSREVALVKVKMWKQRAISLGSLMRKVSTRLRFIMLEEAVEDKNECDHREESFHSNMGNEKIAGEELDIDKEDKEKVESDLSRPPSFEHFKETWNGPTESSLQSKYSKCSTSFCKFRKKNIKGISVIHELSKLKEVGEKWDMM